MSAQTHAEALVDKAVGYGIPGVRVDGGDVLAVYEATREAVERARSGGGPTFIEAVTYRTAPHATADDPRAYIDLERVEQEKQNECLGRYERYLRRQGVLGDDLDKAIKGEAAETMRAGIAAAEAEPDPDIGLVFEHAYANPAGVVSGRACRAAAGSSEATLADLLMVEAINDALHVELERDDAVMVMGEDVGRSGGVFRATAGLRERFGADRCVDTPLAEAGILGTAIGLCMAGWRPVDRDAVRRVLVSVPRPADHARRPLPLAHGRWHGVPARRAHAVRRRSPRAGAARRLARDVLRAHARREGCDSVDARRCEGAARRRDPRSGSRRHLRAEADLPHRAQRGARKATTSCRSARRGSRARATT